MKPFLLLLILLNAAIAQETFYQIDIGYTEGQIPYQGTYLLRPDKNGVFTLKQFGIQQEGKFSAAEIEKILKTSLNPRHGFTVKPHIFDKEKLIKENKAMVIGHANNPGSYSLTEYKTLKEVTAAAEVTAFGSVMRITIDRDSKKWIYNMKKPEHVDTQIKAGDLIIIPQKRWIGR